MTVAFPALDQRLSRNIHELHNYLWVPTWKGDESRIRANLLQGAKSLDAFLRAGGRLRKNAERLASPWNREHQGSSLFELLDDTLGLTASTELVRKGKYREAAQRAQAVVESTSIGVCSAAGRFEVVEEWEARKIDFKEYTARLAKVLEEKFIPQVGQFERVLYSVYDFGADWDGSASKGEQTLAARAAIASTAWCVCQSLAIRSLLGDASKVPEKDFAEVLQTIVTRV